MGKQRRGLTFRKRHLLPKASGYGRYEHGPVCAANAGRKPSPKPGFFSYSAGWWPRMERLFFGALFDVLDALSGNYDQFKLEYAIG